MTIFISSIFIILIFLFLWILLISAKNSRTNEEQYIEDNFFADLTNYLNLFQNLPKTPFIWHITSGKEKAFECFVSIYKWSRDNLMRLRANTVYPNSMEVFLPLNVPMRTIPTISGWRNEFQVLKSLDNKTFVPITNTEIIGGSFGSGFQMRFTTAQAHGLSDGMVEFDNLFSLDAEIY